MGWDCQWVGLTFRCLDGCFARWFLPRYDGYLYARLGDAVEEAMPCLLRRARQGSDGLASSAAHPTLPHGVLLSKCYPPSMTGHCSGLNPNARQE
jgi:hypothetical protein